MLRYKGVLYMKGSDRKVVFQGVHQLMGSDLGPKWTPGEKKQSKMVFIGIDLPRDVLLQGLEGAMESGERAALEVLARPSRRVPPGMLEGGQVNGEAVLRPLATENDLKGLIKP
jgi:hypothetical protein